MRFSSSISRFFLYLCRRRLAPQWSFLVINLASSLQPTIIMKQYIFSLIIACFGTMAASAQYVPTPRATALTHEATGALATSPLEFTPQPSAIDATTLPTSTTLSSTTTAETPRSRYYRGSLHRFRPHFAALAEAGLGSDIDINATVGAQLLPFYYMGGGLNITYWHDGFIRDHDRFDLNLIINPRFEIPTRSIVTPYIDIKSGFSLTHKHGPYFAFSTGVQLKNLILGVGYTMQVTNEEYTGLDGRSCIGTYYSNYVYDGVTFRLGIKF